MITTERTAYRGKRFTMPELSGTNRIIFTPDPWLPDGVDMASQVRLDLNKPFNLARFMQPRLPMRLGKLNPLYRRTFTKPGAPRVLDMPVKMPGSLEYRIPRELVQFFPAIKRIASNEAALNPHRHRDYYAYLTIDQRVVQPGSQLREAPVHVDGFQGARWRPKVEGNHTYTVSDCLPTWFYPYPFDFSKLDIERHDFFWAMNYWVAERNSEGRWQADPWEVTLMDCYCVHRGMETDLPVLRTWLRLSYEVRIFDRLGNAHNPLFNYDWEMVPRDIEALGLRAYHKDCDPSLRVFPWQNLDGSPIQAGAPKTRPNLIPRG